MECLISLSFFTIGDLGLVMTTRIEAGAIAVVVAPASTPTETGAERGGDSHGLAPHTLHAFDSLLIAVSLIIHPVTQLRQCYIDTKNYFDKKFKDQKNNINP